MGSAGRSRLRALDVVTGFTLAGTVSRRADTRTLTWSQALSDPEVAAIAISTENTLHASLTREALEAGKHVLCDYPLAFSSAEISALLALAEKKNLVLHVEHIGLLTPSHAEVTRKLPSLRKLKTGEYHFEGNWSEKWSNPAFAGPLPFIAYSRLLQAAEWFGPFRVLEKNYKADAGRYHLHLKLETAQGGVLDFYEERSPDRERRRWMEAEFENSKLNWHPSYESEGLFAKDLAHFHDRILGKTVSYYKNDLMLHATSLLEGM